MMSELWKLPVPSTALLGAGVLMEIRRGRELALRYEIEDSTTGEERTEAIVFEGMESFKCTCGDACADWMLAAYDRLVEVLDSSWAKELSERLQQIDRSRQVGVARPALRHFMIYFDDGPCYEAVCQAFRIEKL